MGVYKYRSATNAGGVKSGLIEALSERAAIDALRKAGLSPINITVVSDDQKGGGERSKPLPRHVVTAAFSELALLLSAGLTMDRALAICVENIDAPNAKSAFRVLQTQVNQGAPLSRAIYDQAGAFPAIAPAMAEAGEASGQLGDAMTRLTETLEWSDALRRTIRSALVYPTILILIAAAVILMMLLWVVPQFEGLFSDAGAKLPFMTRLVMSLSHGLRRYGPSICGGMILLVFLLGRWLATPRMAPMLDRWIVKTPQLGGLVTAYEVARWTRILSSLLESGVPLAEALAISGRSMGNSELQAVIVRVTLSVRQGASLTATLAQETLMPRGSLGFIRTGEETAQLGLMTARLSSVLDRQLRSQVETLIAILTPAITVVMGMVVATVIASIMTAILGFNDLALSP